ncbi:YncE family protein [Marinicella rhabdoformis]|uniref:YncE family protein n=1 Tax=Marinicella rhabdoformis TaxID=2580566 RepID=UPI0012AEDC9D|nr:hypothetical protein [Marinicella rhabdoformis]
MKKFILGLLLVLIQCNLNAKVAYLPIIEADFPYPSSNSISVLDLDSGQIIKTIQIGQIDYYSAPIFLDNSEKNLYTSIEGNKIIRIDTETLTVVQEWQDPSILSSIDKIFLSSDNSKLFYMILGVGTGINAINQLDLTNNQMTEVIRLPGYSIQAVVVSKNSEYMTLNAFNYTTNHRKISTFKTADLSLKYETTIQNPMSVWLIDNEGENFYYRDYDQGDFVSRKLSDASQNWVFSYPNESVYHSPVEQDTDLLVMGLNSNYIINKNSGIGEAIPTAVNEDPVRLSGSVGRISQDDFLTVSGPEIVCLTGLCSLSSELTIQRIHVENNESELIYQSGYTLGSVANGRFIGANLYQGSSPATPVPFFNQLWQLIVIAFLMVLLAWKFLTLRLD